MKRVINIVITTLTILFFTLALYIMVFGAIANKNNTLLNFFGYSYTAIGTNSMHGDNEDSFDAGAFVVTKKVPFESITVGDIVVFQYKEMRIIHRVVEIYEDGTLRTKGDNNPESESFDYVTKDNYLAKMINHYKFFGLGEKVDQYQLPILGVIIIFLIFYIFFQLFQIIIQVYKKKLEKAEEEIYDEFIKK